MAQDPARPSVHLQPHGDLTPLNQDRLILESGGREALPCRATSPLLRQVWMNLISSALEFTRGMPAARVEIGCEGDRRNPVCFVKDSGVGFDMRFADRLIGVFQRLHRVEDHEGTGVGLAIVHRILQRHHGRIRFHSEPGRGARFCFTLAPRGGLHDATNP